MAHGLVVKANALGDLLALPLQSAIRAQSLALQETLAAIEAIGLDGGKTRAFHLRSEQVTEERTVDPVTGAVSTRQLVRPFEMSIPLLALLPISTVQIQEMNVDFTVEIVDIREQQIGTPSLPAAVSGPSLSGSLSLFSSASPQGPAMKVQMRLVRDRPEGLARVGDILTDLLGGRGQTGRPVDDIPGMPPEVSTILKNRGILTVPQFLTATDPAVIRADFAGSIGVSLAQLEAWRKAASQLQ